MQQHFFSKCTLRRGKCSMYLITPILAKDMASTVVETYISTRDTAFTSHLASILLSCSARQTPCLQFQG